MKKIITLLLSIFLVINISNAQNFVQKGADLNGEASLDNSGWAVSMPDNHTIAIGALANNGNGSYAGHVRIYRWNPANGGTWVRKGIDIDGEAPFDNSGWSLSMPDSNTIAIGAPNNNGNILFSGHVRIYRWNGSAWVQKGMDIEGEASNDGAGHSVSMPDSNTIAIGAQFNDGNFSNAGHVRIYHWNGSAWVQKGIDIDGVAADDRSGYSVSMPDSNTVAIGTPLHNGNFIGAGHVRIFRWNGSAWVQQGSDIDGEAAGDGSGQSVSMPDSNTVAIGAIGNDGNGSNAGHARIYQ